MPSSGSTKSASNTAESDLFDELATRHDASSRRKLKPDYLFSPGASGVLVALEAGGARWSCPTLRPRPVPSEFLARMRSPSERWCLYLSTPVYPCGGGAQTAPPLEKNEENGASLPVYTYLAKTYRALTHAPLRPSIFSLFSKKRIL